MTIFCGVVELCQLLTMASGPNIRKKMSTNIMNLWSFVTNIPIKVLRYNQVFVFVYIPILPLGGKRVINNVPYAEHRLLNYQVGEMKREASEEIYNSWFKAQ